MSARITRMIFSPPASREERPVGYASMESPRGGCSDPTLTMALNEVEAGLYGR